ncbi:MAG: hypothetical protein WCI57_01770 [Candidatus Berkelbacteria bacterium]
MQTFAKFDHSQLHYEVVPGELTVRAHWGGETVCSITATVDDDSHTFTPDFSNFDCACCDENVREELLDILESQAISLGYTLALVAA